VKLRFRKLIRRVPGNGRLSVRARRRPGRGAASPDVRYGTVRGAAPAQPGAWLNDLAVAETVAAAIRRTYLECIGQGGSTPSPLRFRLDRRDVYLNLRASEHALHICLLIDASASMAGRRIMAAKHLARHLLVSTRDRIAVIAFQERDVRVYVPFTRDYGLVEEGLSRIQPMGLTPLAQGLTRSMELIRSSRVRRPLLLLITDGIPTVPKWSVDPLADALEAARHVRAGRIPFGCIGLQPSRRYLEHLAREAGGTLHVVDELSEESLITIAHQERLKLAPQAR
jgi:magnesium chelatase subunit D